MIDNSIHFHSLTDFILDKEDKKRDWIISSIIEEGKELGEINIIFCDDKSLLEKKQYIFKSRHTYRHYHIRLLGVKHYKWRYFYKRRKSARQ